LLINDKILGNEPGLLAYYSFAEGNKQFVYDTTTSDNNCNLNADTNGLGEGKFWNTRFFYKVWN
jgi:hypothetical protein